MTKRERQKRLQNLNRMAEMIEAERVFHLAILDLERRGEIECRDGMVSITEKGLKMGGRNE